jgi:hypothetical protein
MDPLTISILAGAGMQAFGQFQSGQASAKAARQQAKLKQAQAQEMLNRMAIQEGRIRDQGEAFKGQQLTEFGSSGIQLGTGSTLIAMEDANLKINQQVEDMKRDTIFRANQLMIGADYEIQQGRDSISAGAVMAGGSLLEGYKDYKKHVA